MMNRRILRIVLTALLVTIAGLTIVSSQEEEGYVGSEMCAFCHEDVVEKLTFGPHSVAPFWDGERSCENCHGPGAEHADGDVEAIVRINELPPLEASAICLTCHDRQESHFNSRISIHKLSDISCVDCHSPHSTRYMMLDKRGTDACVSCHHNVVSEFAQARHHPVADKGAACEQCHQPHSAVTLRGSKGFPANCNACHAEKAGPFLYPHDVSIVDGCQACHRVHGTSSRHLLNADRQVNLCYQCHSAATTPPWHSAPRFLAEKCSACHTAIHGSNTNPFFLED